MRDLSRHLGSAFSSGNTHVLELHRQIKPLEDKMGTLVGQSRMARGDELLESYTSIDGRLLGRVRKALLEDNVEVVDGVQKALLECPPRAPPRRAGAADRRRPSMGRFTIL